jgi:hypothetical protein
VLDQYVKCALVEEAGPRAVVVVRLRLKDAQRVVWGGGLHSDDRAVNRAVSASLLRGYGYGTIYRSVRVDNLHDKP